MAALRFAAAAAAVLLLLLALTSMMAAQAEAQTVCPDVNKQCGDCIGACSRGSAKDCNDCIIGRGACAALCGVTDISSCRTRCQAIFDGCEVPCASAVEQSEREECHTACVTAKNTCESAPTCNTPAN